MGHGGRRLCQLPDGSDRSGDYQLYPHRRDFREGGQEKYDHGRSGIDADQLFAAIFFTEYHAVINLGFALIGMGWAAVSVNSLPMVVEMCSSEDVGKYTGLYYTFSMSAQIVTPILSGVFLQYVSYRTLFPYACVFTVAAMITMSMVHHGDNKPERKKICWKILT